MNRSAEQTNRPRTASRFTRFVCPALRFIPHEPRRKDTHFLSVQDSLGYATAVGLLTLTFRYHKIYYHARNSSQSPTFKFNKQKKKLYLFISSISIIVSEEGGGGGGGNGSQRQKNEYKCALVAQKYTI